MKHLLLAFIFIFSIQVNSQVAVCDYTNSTNCVSNYNPSAINGANDYGLFMRQNLQYFSPDNDNIKTVKVRFVLLQRDGDAANNIGGFHLGPDDNDPTNDNYHRTLWNRVVGSLNYWLGNMDENISNGNCNPNNKIDTKVRFDVDLINYEDSTYWGDPYSGCLTSCPNPGSPNWYLNDLNDELNNTLGERINLFFASNPTTYQNAINGLPATTCTGACADMPRLRCEGYVSQAAFFRGKFANLLLDRAAAINATDGTYWASPCIHTDDWTVPCIENTDYTSGDNNGIPINQDWGNNRYTWHHTSLVRLILHEILHNLSLAHTEDGTSGSPDQNQADDWPFYEDQCNIMCNHCFQSFGINSLQVDRIHKALSVTEARKYVEGCINDDAPLEFTADHTINYDFKTYQDVIVKSGATLTLTCALRMPKDAKIIVERGAKFIVNGGYITNACDGERWGGIEVWGNQAGAEHSDMVNVDAQGDFNGTFTQSSTDSGILYITDGSVIENGPDGTIRNFRVAPYGTDWRGGIIIAEDSRFVNNIRTAEFLQYNFANESFFKNCDFEVNEDFAAITDQVSIWDCNGIKFTDCRFNIMWDDTQRASAPKTFGAAPKGIYSINASYGVKNTSFNNFNMGIHVQETVPSNELISVEGDYDDATTEFNGCVFGIATENLARVEVLGCTFHTNLSGLSIPAEAYGLTFKGDGAENNIESNTFVNTDNSSFCYGINLQATNTCNANIDENTLIGWRNSIDFHNNNRNATFTCNDLSSTEYDVHLYGDAQEAGKIYGSQGSSTVPAGNLFSDVDCNNVLGDEHIRVDQFADAFSYFHLPDARHDPICSSTIVNNNDIGENAPLNCAYAQGDGGTTDGGTTDGGGVPHPGNSGQPVSEGIPTKSNTTVCKRVGCYMEAIDDRDVLVNTMAFGNSQVLFDALSINASSVETFVLFGQASPYLSDKVMREMLASSMSSTRKGIILTKNSPISDELMVKAYDEVSSNTYNKLYVIKQSGKKSKRKKLEENITHQKLKVTLSLNSLLNEAKEQENYEEGILLLESEGSNYSKKRMIGWMRYFNETETINNIIADTEFAETEMSEFYKIQQITDKIEADRFSTELTKTITEQDRLFLEDLTDGASLNKYYACVALSLLNGTYCDTHNHSHDEDDFVSKRGSNSGYPEPIDGYTDLVEIYPNPTQGQIDIKLWEIDFNDEVTIQITDINGRLVDVQTALEEPYRYSFDSANGNGIYFANILVNGVAIHNQKIVLIR